jgi:hypothetical protein
MCGIIRLSRRDCKRQNTDKLNNQIIITWKGLNRLQEAPTVLGPWTDTHQSSPASFDARLGNEFFRTVR